MLAAYKRDNLLIEIMFPITWGGVWEYPYPEAQDLIRQMRDLFGASKLVWGSDMPNLERFCTYRQCVDYVRKHCPFLTREREGRRARPQRRAAVRPQSMICRVSHGRWKQPREEQKRGHGGA